MPRDVQIVRSADEAVPKDYSIPKDAEVILRAVKATFTDNGAAVDWLPCVTLLSDSGHKIAQALDPNVQVTAGDDAEVSWFPGVKPSRAAVATGGATYAQGHDTSFQILPALGTLQPGFANVSTTDAAVLAWSTSVLANDTLTLADGHVAIVWASCAIQGGQNNKDAFIRVSALDDQIAHDGNIGQSFQGFAFPPGPAKGQPNFQDQTVVLASGNSVPIKYRLSNNAAGAQGVPLIYMAALAFAV